MKFKFGNSVKITEGFHEGFTGLVIDYSIGSKCYIVKTDLKIINNEGFSPEVRINEDHLELIK